MPTLLFVFLALSCNWIGPDVDGDGLPVGEDCDEGRLPWDHFGADVWDVERG